MSGQIDKLKNIIEQSDNIVFFGGAGVSTESNIPDFRSENSLNSTMKKYNYTPEDILSSTFFYAKTDIFYDYLKNDMIYIKAKPNDAHVALTKLEELGKLKAIVTQNIDGLHQKAGSKNVLELHGSIERYYCIKCRKYFNLDYLMKANGIPYCDKCRNIIKPDVVLYEENLNNQIINKAIDYISKCDTLIVGGTSLVVYPAAGLINYFNGRNIVIINKGKTSYDVRADLVINDSIGKVFNETILK